VPPLMLGEEEALAVIWGLLLTGRSGSGPASALAVETASAKVRRVLPAVLTARIDAVVEAVDFLPSESETAQATGRRVDDGAEMRALLELAEAVRGRRPVAFGYTSRHGRVEERSVEPYGVVAHRGLLYLTGFDVTRQAARTFRVDRIAELRMLAGTFTRPTDTDDDPVNQVRGPLSAAPDRHSVSVCIRADIAHVRTFIPEMLASVTPIPAAEDGDGWLRVFLHAERLEWVAGRLAVIDRPFIIEYPEELCDKVSALGQRLIAAASQRESHT
jgi:predicted DNA-binding transcriptional regulator YafY